MFARLAFVQVPPKFSVPSSMETVAPMTTRESAIVVVAPVADKLVSEVFSLLPLLILKGTPEVATPRKA